MQLSIPIDAVRAAVQEKAKPIEGPLPSLEFVEAETFSGRDSVEDSQVALGDADAECKQMSSFPACLSRTDENAKGQALAAKKQLTQDIAAEAEKR